MEKLLRHDFIVLYGILFPALGGQGGCGNRVALGSPRSEQCAHRASSMQQACAGA